MAILNWRDHPRLRFVDFPPAAVNKGAVFIALDLNDSAWISDGTTYYPIGDQGLSAPNFGEYTWATKPAADSLPVRSRISIPEWDNSEWYTDGTYWRPVGGRAMMLNWAGNGAVALTSGTFAQVAGMPTPVMPAGFVATPGAYVRNVLKVFRKVAAGANDQVGSIRINANVVDINARHYGGLNFTSSTATNMYTLDILTAVNVIGGYFATLAATAGAVPADASVATALNTALDNQPIIVSARGVSVAGLDTLYFDSWLIELYA